MPFNRVISVRCESAISPLANISMSWKKNPAQITPPDANTINITIKDLLLMYLFIIDC